MGKTGTVRLKGRAMEALRFSCFERDKWRCQECGRWIAWGEDWSNPQGRPVGEMAHIKSRGAGGSDTLDNVRTLCPKCHGDEHNAGGKPCPKRERLA